MARRLRWLGLGMAVCFIVLFLQLNNIQVVKASHYANSPSNPAKKLALYSQPRGVIQSADGVVLAMSTKVAHPCTLCHKYSRSYPTGSLFVHVVGFLSPIYTEAGVEASYDSFLAAHNRPIRTIGDLLTTSTVYDSVTLTMSSKLQQTLQQALAGRDGAVVVLDPNNGGVLAMYSNPNYDPNPLAALKGNGGVDQAAEEAGWAQDIARSSYDFAPLTSLAYQDHFPPGSTFKVLTTAATYDHSPQLVNTPMTYYNCIPPHTFGGQTTTLCNFGASGCGGTIAQMLPPSCDTGYAVLGTRVGAASMTAEADAFGFNQQPPLDLPHSGNEVSQFLQPSCYQDAQVFLAFSSIGQDCTVASPLQMAMVAGGIANGGVVMTPHVMYEIRDQQNNLVKRYTPTPWLKATTTQTANAVRDLMVKVVQYGTASLVGFPPQDHVAAKTGTAQVGLGNTLTTDWMIAFAPADVPKVAIAVVMPHQPRDETGALIAGPVMRTVIQAALAGQ
jgi:peptidoglycan glycosyltransferase